MGIKARLRPWLGVPLLVFCSAALADNAMTTESADLYAGPDDAYPVVAQLDSNMPIQVMGCLDDWSWCDVVADGTRGWMYAPDITYAYQGGYVPLYSYAPSLGIAVVPFSIDVYWDRYYHGRPWYGERERWAHRDLHHRRPEGPPPSAGPPPRPEHRDGPREAARPDHRDLHLGSARNDEHHDNAFRRPEPSPPPRPAEAPPHPEAHTLPAPGSAHAPPHEQPHEDHSRVPGPGHAAPPPHEERPRAERPHEEEHPH
ncbi:MAG TPA: SH3 domain-containing protein [Steroidobacteraceae bacterium]